MPRSQRFLPGIVLPSGLLTSVPLARPRTRGEKFQAVAALFPVILCLLFLVFAAPDFAQSAAQDREVAAKKKGGADSTERKQTVAATELAVPPQALKQFHKASELMAKKQWNKAIPPLEKAVYLYPKFAAAYDSLGVIYDNLGNKVVARDAWLRAVQIDDRFVPSYISLAKNDIALHIFPDAEAMLKKALVGDPGNSQVRALLANVELLNQHYDDAIADCNQIHSISKEAHASVHFVAAQAYEHQNRPAEANKELQALLAEEPTGPLADQAHEEMAKLQTPTAANVDPSGSPSAEIEVPMPASSNWAPPDIDQAPPDTESTPPCSLPDVLHKTADKVMELVDNLQRFSAEEEIEHTELDKGGYLLLTRTGHFKYVAEIKEVPTHRLAVNEYRNSTLAPNVFPSRLATTGTAAFALIFHNDYADDFSMRCEGRAAILGQPAWVVHFQQRSDKLPRFRNYYVAKNWYSVKLKGRAWISADNFQVLRLETDLVEPIKEIELRREHLIIEYHAVDFPKRQLQLWLPSSTDIYLDFRSHKYHDRHSFSDFQLFWVDTNQKDAVDKLQAAQ
jgi:tetratricopeptide (TPR) repeat protein